MQDDDAFLAERFEANRTNLRAVAYRMLGSLSEADDAVQEAWLRAQPRRRRRRSTNLRRVADDGRRAGLPEHAALAHGRGARSPWTLDVPEPIVEPRGRHRPRARGAAGRLGRPRAARRARDAAAGRAASRSCCTTCSPCRSTRSRRSSGAPRTRHGSSPSRARRRVQGRAPIPTPISPVSGRWWRRSSQRRATGGSTRCWRSLDPRRRAFEPTAPPVRVGAVRGGRGAESRGRDLLGASPGRARPRSWAAPSGSSWMRSGARPRMVFDFTIGGRQGRRDRPDPPTPSASASSSRLILDA